MAASFQILDWVLLAVTAFFLLTGLFRGLSGEVGSVLGLIAAILAGWLAYAAVASLMAAHAPQLGRPAVWLADGVVALLAFGIVRRLSAKFISFLIPQPTNALLGLLAGALKAAALIVALALSGVVTDGSAECGILTRFSEILRVTAPLVSRL